MFCFGIVLNISGWDRNLTHPFAPEEDFLSSTWNSSPTEAIFLSLILSGSELLFCLLLVKANKPNKTLEPLEDTKPVLRLFFFCLV